MDSLLFWMIPLSAFAALCFAYYFHKQMMKESEGTPQMVKIAAAVRKGAMSYLKQQYKVVAFVFWDWLSCSPSWLTDFRYRTHGCLWLFSQVVSFRAYRVFWE